MAKPGDIVRYLNDVGGGRILRIEGNMAIVDDDGFETPVLVRDCVVVTPAEEAAAYSKAQEEPTEAQSGKPASLASAPTSDFELTEEDIAETPEGDSLNIVLAYEPTDIKRLSQTAYDAYLVNDSNYYLNFCYLTRGADDQGWTTRYAGVLEPNIQVLLGRVEREDLVDMDHVAVQYVAFKRGREFSLKAPGAIDYKLDTTKFFKLHCFRDNIYFDSPVLALDIVRDDVPVRPLAVDNATKSLERELRAKRNADRRPARKRVVKHSESRRGDIIEVDLHIHELVDTTRGLSAADMLNLQVDEFRRVMDANLGHHGQKIVFIHGKGEGVLRQALAKELKHRYKGHDVQDASFQQYGFGATQVTIK